MTDRRAPLRLATSGFASIYLIVPPGSFQEEFEHVSEVLKKTSPGSKERHTIVDTPEVLYLLGQSRFAARVEVSDFRDVADRAYPDRRSKALVSNAVFSVPYLLEPGKKPQLEKSDPGVLRFMTHLRVRRTVYEKDPVLAETLILERLRELADNLEAETSIEAGIGWADFIISGVVAPGKFNTFLELLVEFNRVGIDPAVGRGDSVVKRSLTLLGYTWTGERQPPIIEGNFKALMFIRARPGRLSDIERLAKEAFSDPSKIHLPHFKREPEVEFVDGKIDVIVSVGKPMPDFLKQHQQLSEVTGRDAIEKFETHVVFGHEIFRNLENDAQTAPDYGADCGCIGKLRAPHYDLHSIPHALANTIRNIEFLFSSTLRDPTNCCDVRSPILACEESLKRLLKAEEADRIEVNLFAQRVHGHRFVDAKEEEAVFRANAKVVETLLRIDRWIRTSERVLRQRTIGSFEEFLGQSDRAVSYRGGAQKILYVADNLMNDFYAKVVALDRPEPFLTSLYDSVDRIQNVVGTGLVRMPVRSLFFLPGAVPDLWHEVGVFHFLRTIPAGFLRLDLAEELDRDLYRDLADHFGDLISFLYGFRLDIEQFTTALIEGWLDSQPYAAVPDLAQQWSFAQLLTRMIAVSWFLLEETEPFRTAEPREDVLIVLYEEACGFAQRYSSKRIPTPSNITKGRVLWNLQSDLLSSGLRFLRSKLHDEDIDDARKTLESKWSDEELPEFFGPATLPSFDEAADINDEFRDLFWAVARAKKRARQGGDPQNAFAPTAALTHGAALEYYRRALARPR